MLQKLKSGLVVVYLMFLTGCSFPWGQLIPPAANFALGFYDANDYYAKECLWYDEVRLNVETKEWLLNNSPPDIVSQDLAQVSRNNDIYKEVCKKDKNMADKLKSKAERILQ